MGDLKTFVEVLASKLTESFPQRVRVDRKGRLFGTRQPVRSLSVTFGDIDYELENAEGRITCRRRTIVHGVVLKSEQVSLEEWIVSFSRELTKLAEETESDRLALGRLLTE